MHDVPIHKEYGCDGGNEDEPEPQEDVNLPEREINKSSLDCLLFISAPAFAQLVSMLAIQHQYIISLQFFDMQSTPLTISLASNQNVLDKNLVLQKFQCLMFTFSLIMFSGRTQRASCTSIVPETPYLWKLHFDTCVD